QPPALRFVDEDRVGGVHRRDLLGGLAREYWRAALTRLRTLHLGLHARSDATLFRDGTSEAGWWSRPGRLHQPAWSELGGGEGVHRAGAIERGARRTAGAAPRVAGGPVGRAWRGYGAAAQGGSHRTRAPVRVELADERRHSGGMRRRHRRTADPDPAV